MEAFLNANMSALQAYVAQGNSLFINAAPNEGDVMSFGFGGVTLRYSDFSNTGTIVNTGHPIFQGPATPVIATYSGSSFTHASVSGGGITPLITDSTGDAVLAELTCGAGTVLFGGMTTTNFHSPQPQSNNLRTDILAYVAGKAVTGGSYLVRADAGATLTITTSTPGDGPGEPVSTLDPQLKLYAPDGTEVAASLNGAADGRNARIVYTVPAAGGGLYRLDVRAENGTAGDYVVRVEGGSVSQSAFQVASSVPANAATLNQLATSIDLNFSAPLLLSSLADTDLVLQGPAGTTPLVTGVTYVDADTARFQVSLPAVEGTYSYSLAGGSVSNLQGIGNTAYNGSFVVDLTAPKVVSQSPAVQSLSPFNTWTLTFSEALDPATVQTSDFVLRNPSNSVISIS